jgi:hypothetical protein
MERGSEHRVRFPMVSEKEGARRTSPPFPVCTRPRPESRGAKDPGEVAVEASG